MKFKSKVEEAFDALSGSPKINTHIPYIVVENFPLLGLFTSLRFLEWVSQNPDGVISLPTGKTPEYFIKWTGHLLENWDTPKVKDLKEKYGIGDLEKPSLEGLHFVQIDEFYPISSRQHNSFYNYVKKYYLDGFGLDPNNALLINSDEIQLAGGRHFVEVFPDNRVDLSLRYREPKSQLFTLNNLITKQIAEEVNVKLTDDEKSILAESRTADPDAIEAYIRGLIYWDMLNPM